MKIPLKIAFVLLSTSMLAACSKKENTDYQNQKHDVPNTTDQDVILPPAWAFGILYGSYTNQDQSIELINEIIEHDYPIDAYWIDSWIWDWENQGKGPKKYMDFVADTVSYYDMEEMWSFMESKNKLPPIFGVITNHCEYRRESAECRVQTGAPVRCRISLFDILHFPLDIFRLRLSGRQNS